jgi:hypothetical protein
MFSGRSPITLHSYYYILMLYSPTRLCTPVTSSSNFDTLPRILARQLQHRTLERVQWLKKRISRC